MSTAQLHRPIILPQLDRRHFIQRQGTIAQTCPGHCSLGPLYLALLPKPLEAPLATAMCTVHRIAQCLLLLLCSHRHQRCHPHRCRQSHLHCPRCMQAATRTAVVCSMPRCRRGRFDHRRFHTATLSLTVTHYRTHCRTHCRIHCMVRWMAVVTIRWAFDGHRSRACQTLT